jgi:branched-chain amino acid transport system substrate-binding protein
VQTKQFALLLVLIVIFAAVGVAWQMHSPLSVVSSSEARPIKIGLVACYQKAEGNDMDRAAKLAVDQINAAGGVYVAEWGTNVPIELVIADTKDDSPSNAVEPVKRAITQDNVDLLIGGYASAGTLANEVVAIENRVPYIVTGASTTLVTRRGPQGDYGGLAENDPKRITDAEGMSYIFHYCVTTYEYSKTILNFLTESMKPLLDRTYGFDESRNLRLAVIYRNDAFGQGVLADSKSIIESDNLPITIVQEVNYPTTTTSFQTELGIIKSSSPDVVYVVDFIANTAEIIKEGQRDVGLNTVYISVECVDDPQFYTLIGTYGDTQLIESQFGPYAQPYYLPAIGDYVTSYSAKYGKSPGFMGASTYDAFYLAKYAIEKAGTVDKAAIREAIESSSMEQLLMMTQTGKIEFSTGLNYHEVQIITFVEQLHYDEQLGECRAKIVYPEIVPVVGRLRQADLVLPKNYVPGNP